MRSGKTYLPIFTCPWCLVALLFDCWFACWHHRWAITFMGSLALLLVPCSRVRCPLFRSLVGWLSCLIVWAAAWLLASSVACFVGRLTSRLGVQQANSLGAHVVEWADMQWAGGGDGGKDNECDVQGRCNAICRHPTAVKPNGLTSRRRSNPAPSKSAHKQAGS